MPGCFCGCVFHFLSQLTRPLGSLSISFSKPFFICRRFDYDLVIHFDEFNFVTAFDATTVPQFLRNRHLSPISDFPFVFRHTYSYFFHTDIGVGGMVIQFALFSDQWFQVIICLKNRISTEPSQHRISCSLKYIYSPVSRLRRMETQLRMYLSGTIAAVAAFLFVSLAFSGQFNFIHGGVFVVFFIVVMIVFANFVKWAESLESN